MRTRIKRFIGMKVCDFGLFILSLGPKDLEDREAYKHLILEWRKFYDMK